MLAALVILRLVILHPHDFSCRKAGYCGICGNFNQPVSAHLIGDFHNFLCSTLVAPDNALADRLVLCVKHNKSVHLTRKSYTLNVFYINT